MPTKIIESKLIIKGEDQATPKLSGLLRFIDRLALKMEKLGKAGLGEPGQAYRTGGPKGSQRSEFAPGGAEAPRGSAYRDMLRQLGAHVPGEAPPLPPPPPPGIRRLEQGEKWSKGGGGGGGAGAGGGWQKFARGMGYGMGAAGGLISGATHQLTPIVGGMLSAAGGAMMGNAITAIPGAAAMYAGAIMQVATIGAQPAMQHYGELQGTYRKLDMLGAAGRSNRARGIGSRNGALTLSESIRYGGQLQKFGGFEGLGTMAGMRFGGFEPDVMMPYFEQATRAGAAGGLKKGDYDYLAKTVAVGFSKQGLPSVEQAIETLSGLMGNASNYLADISQDQTAELGAMTRWMEGSGTAYLRGPRGVQAMGKVQNWVATQGDPAKEMFLWHAMSKAKPGMNYFDMQEYRESTAGLMTTLGSFAGIDRNMAAMMMKDQGMGSFTQNKALLEAYDRKEDPTKLKEMLDNANPGSIDFKATKSTADNFQVNTAKLEELRVLWSEKFLPKYFQMEEALTIAIQGLTSKLDIPTQVGLLTTGIEALGKFAATVNKETITSAIWDAVKAGVPVIGLGENAYKGGKFIFEEGKKGLGLGDAKKPNN